jgi:hypothetical protein
VGLLTNWRPQSLHLRLGLPLCVEPFLMVWQEPHLGQRNIEAGESFVRKLCSKSSSPSNQDLIIQEKILIEKAIIKSKFLNHKKQIFYIYQVIIFISQYSTQLRLDKQESYATTIGSLPGEVSIHEV